MREIKFRAWDEQNKKMFHNVQFIKSGDEGNDWICFCEGVNYKINDHQIVFDNPYFSQQIKLMQFTGLKDSQGVDIYEGDIISQAWSDGESNIGTVIYDEYEAMFKIDYPNGGGSIMNHPTLTKEIVGNIHENPELLK